jgi:hypothetical protein
MKKRNQRGPGLSREALDKVADLDEKLQWGLISARRYDQEYERILLSECSADLNEISGKAKPKKKARWKAFSDPSLSSGFGRVPAFPHGERSDRRKGRTAYLAKKIS